MGLAAWKGLCILTLQNQHYCTRIPGLDTWTGSCSEPRTSCMVSVRPAAEQVDWRRHCVYQCYTSSAPGSTSPSQTTTETRRCRCRWTSSCPVQQSPIHINYTHGQNVHVNVSYQWNNMVAQCWQIMCPSAFVAIVIVSLSGAAYMGERGQMPQRGEKFHQFVTILENIWYVYGVAKVLLSFYCPISAEK